MNCLFAPQKFRATVQVAGRTVRRTIERIALIAIGAGLAGAASSVAAITTSTMTLAVSPNPAFTSQSVTLTATVTGSSPTGSVTFKDGTTSLGSATLSGGTATLTRSFTTAGTHSLTATYAGNAANTASTSPIASLTVNAKVATTTTLVASPTAAFVGQNVALTATVSGSNPAGTVTFKDGTTTLGTATLASGVATLTKTFTTVGARSLTAVYAGNAGNNASTSAAVIETISAKSTTTTQLSVSPTSAYVSQAVVLTATVAGASPTGTVTFKDGTTTLGSSTLVNGLATLTKTFSTAGAHSLTAVYAGDVANNSSTSLAVSLPVTARLSTTVSLVSSATTVTGGQPIQLTATVGGGSSPTGTITFKDGANAIATVALSSGQASTTTAFDANGSSSNHSLTAVYSGDASNNSSTSSAVRVSASLNSTSMNVASMASPSGLNQPVSFTVSLTSQYPQAIPTGTVQVSEANVPLGSGIVGPDGKAIITIAFAAAGQHFLVFQYGGDSNHTGAFRSVTQYVDVQVASSISLVVTPAVRYVGDPVTIVATVTGSTPPPTGTLQLATGGGVTSLLDDQGVATFAYTPRYAGTWSLNFDYLGDGANQTSYLRYSLSVLKAVTSTTLSAIPAVPAVGDLVVLRAKIVGGSPTGSMVFTDGVTTIGTAPIVAGEARLNVPFSVPGTHPIVASYAGDENNQASSSSILSLAVGAGGGSSPGELTWRFAYDAVGNMIAERDPNGSDTVLVYDALGRATTVIPPPSVVGGSQPSIGMTFDGLDKLSSVTDRRGLVTAYGVDGLGNVRTLASPDSGSSSASFDASGNPAARTDARAKITSATYDDLGRLASLAYSEGLPTLFEYDGGATPTANAVGQLTKITDESGSTSYTFDGLGRVLSKSQSINTGSGSRTLVTSYAWGSAGTANGKLVAMTYPSGNRINVAYDAVGRPSALTLNPVNANGIGTNGATTIPLLSNVTYNANNSISGWTWSDGTVYQRTFDAYGRLLSYPLSNPNLPASGGVLRTVQYDPAGRITGLLHSNANGTVAQLDHTYAYDPLDRLVDAVVGPLHYGYVYDIGGNRTSRVIEGTSYAHTVSATSNRLTQVEVAGTAGKESRQIQSDAAGNMTSDGNATYAFSARGRLASATHASTTTSYLYNGLEQRVAKAGPSVSGGVTYYAYDEQGRLVGQYGSSLEGLSELIFLQELPVLAIAATGLASQSTLQVSVGNVFADHLATPRKVLRASDGLVLWDWGSAEPFGASGPNENPAGAGTYVFTWRFPGQVFDAETGNSDNYHRSYAAGLGRYVQSDPIGLAGGINTYTYVEGDPLRHIDPLGLDSTTYSAYIPVFGPIGPGGALTFGTNPNGTGFMTFRLAIGLGGGWKYDPDGKRPGYNDTASCDWGAGGSLYGGYDFNAGTVFSQLSATRGVNSSPNGPEFYSQPSAKSGLRGKHKGINMSVSVGTQFTAFGGGSCVCR